MKYITLIIGLLVVGCVITSQITGVYECRDSSNIWGLVLLENGVAQEFKNGVKVDESKWKIVRTEAKRGIYEELWVEGEDGNYGFLRINPDGSLTDIGLMDNEGKRVARKEHDQVTFKKIK